MPRIGELSFENAKESQTRYHPKKKKKKKSSSVFIPTIHAIYALCLLPPSTTS
jgi:hypothetical protein